MPVASWKYAASTLYCEVMKFRFDYPVRIVPEAGPKDSLSYYLYSDSLPGKR